MKKIPVDIRYYITINGEVFSKRSGNFKRVKYQRDISGKYNRVALGDKHYLVHRLVAMTYFPMKDFQTLEVNHINGIKLDNRLINLEWVTRGQNQKHAYDTGLKKIPKGEDNANHKLSDDCVIEIYNNLMEGVSIKFLAETYKVSSTTITRIKKKSAWSHVTHCYPDIKVRYRKKPLTSLQELGVKLAIESGNTFKETIELLDFKVSRDQFYRIKSLL